MILTLFPVLIGFIFCFGLVITVVVPPVVISLPLLS